MENNQRSDILINGIEATWEIDMLGDIKGLYLGTFKFRCYLLPNQQLAAGRRYRELLGPQALLATDHENLLAYSISQLESRIIQAPPFWYSEFMNGNIPDEAVLSKVLDAAISSEIKYKQLMKEKKESSIKRANDAIERLNKDKEISAKDNKESKEDGSSDV